MVDSQLESKLKDMYSELWAMNLPEILVGAGQILAKGIHADLKQMFGDNIHVTIGYFR